MTQTLTVLGMKVIVDAPKTPGICISPARYAHPGQAEGRNVPKPPSNEQGA